MNLGGSLLATMAILSNAASSATLDPTPTPKNTTTTTTTPPCSRIPSYDAGRVTGMVCAESPGPDRVVIDLGDDWAPGLLSETAELPQAYRATFVQLANERPGEGEAWDTARRDRYYELFGIFPSPSVVRRRLLDEDRHACHATVGDQPLRETGKSTAAVQAAQRHLRCEGLLPGRARDGTFDARTREALALYQRRHMIPSRAALDAETRAALLTPSRELDFRTLLRALRERVVDATGLIEDGSAQNRWQPILGRWIDSAEYRRELRAGTLERGAPDLVARATEAAATALGWTSPDAATRALAGELPAHVAVQLPPAPPYHAAPMRLRVEIDRGDVWLEYPLDAAGRPRPSPVRNRPTLTLFVETESGEVPLVRWPTTIGAWQPERQADGTVALRYKASPVGRRYWWYLVAGPAWFPPPTIPDEELVRRRPDGTWTANHDAVGPGYRSAYGLMALLHHRGVATDGDVTALADIDIRTHGSGSYRSILRGSSHGCHRLFNHLAIRLGSFLLASQPHARHGLVEERYGRTILWKGRALPLHATTRGYRYELVPPIPVDVLPGRTVRARPTGARPLRLPAPPQALDGGVTADDQPSVAVGRGLDGLGL